jgi:pectate lyase
MRSVSQILALVMVIGMVGAVHAGLRRRSPGPPPATDPQPAAFPGAEGFGAMTAGGRGGAVIEVTNLDDRGPGSFRAAVESPGPRIVVFRVGGTIWLDSSLEIRDPYITIAGQTAPGGGILLRNSDLNSRTPLKVKTHDVVIRYIRSRPGSHPNENGTLDALNIASTEAGVVHDVIVDHGSFSWATDEVTNVYYDAHDITIQWSIIAEGLDCATHVEDGELQCHSMGMLLGSEGSGNISIHHNLFAHNRHRNPRIKTTGTVDVVNNVVYNSGSGNGWRSPTYVHGGRAIVPANYVGNFFKPGADTGAAEWFIDTKEVVEVFAANNAVPHEVIDPDSADMLVPFRHPAPAVTTFPASFNFDAVLEGAGASLALDCDGSPRVRRDSVDERIIMETRLGTGRIIDDPSEVGGWPEIASGTPCPDSDHDGMPDDFEMQHGFDAEDPADGPLDSDGDGYTNVEEFLNATDPLD